MLNPVWGNIWSMKQGMKRLTLTLALALTFTGVCGKNTLQELNRPSVKTDGNTELCGLGKCKRVGGFAFDNITRIVVYCRPDSFGTESDRNRFALVFAHKPASL